MIRTWRLDTPSQTLVLASFEDRVAQMIYWSAPLPQTEDLEALALGTRIAPAGGMLDAVADLSVLPEAGHGYPGQPGLRWRLEDSDQSLATFAYHGEAIETGDAGAARLELVFAMPGDGVTLALSFAVSAGSDVFGVRATLTNRTTTPRVLDHWCPMTIALTPAVRGVTTFGGRWCGEFQRRDLDLAAGLQCAAGAPGRTGHESQPSVLVETPADVLGLHLACGSGHRILAERLSDGRAALQIAPEFGPAGQRLDPGGQLVSDILYLARARTANAVSQAFHTHMRAHVLPPQTRRPRPVHYNCWEAVYFDHRPDVLIDLARRAAALGVERFVLDDGWFGRRDDDTSGLGDWVVDRRKWPDGLDPLVRTVTALGMEFGLWVEPEMVNPDSDLFRAHPDWVLGPRHQVSGRNQLVLDLTRPAVSEYLFDRLDAVLSEHPIAYLKWDHNRVLPFADRRQHKAALALMARLVAQHPDLEIETCASGGGRVDYETLSVCSRFWTSDSNDAATRWEIQRGASYFYPPEIMGSHIGPRICHTSGRQFPLGFKAAVAGSRAMGLEMDLRELTPAEAAEITAAISRFQARRELLHTGLLYRLESADPQVMAEMHMARDGARFVVFAAQMQPSAQPCAHPLRLEGLDPASTYRVQLENPQDVPRVLNRGARNPLVAGSPVCLTGAALTNLGLQMPNAFPDTIWTLNGERL